MARACSICTHPQRAEIDAAIVSGEANRRIAAHFGAAESSIRRHREGHLPAALAAGCQQVKQDEEATAGAALVRQVRRQEAAEERRQIDIQAELERCMERVRKLSDACDRWLADPEDPDRYDIGPRAEEITVIYETIVGATPTGRELTERKRESLSSLLRRAQAASGVDFIKGCQVRHADPRTLVLQAASSAEGQMRLFADLLKMLADARRMSDFQEALLAEIRQVSPETAHAIVDRIQRALIQRGALGEPPALPG